MIKFRPRPTIFSKSIQFHAVVLGLPDPLLPMPAKGEERRVRKKGTKEMSQWKDRGKIKEKVQFQGAPGPPPPLPPPPSPLPPSYCHQRNRLPGLCLLMEDQDGRSCLSLWKSVLREDARGCSHKQALPTLFHSVFICRFQASHLTKRR